MSRRSLLQEFRDFLGSVISFPADYFAGWMGVAPSEAGVEVNELTAMQIAAFVGCVRVISGAIATLPFRVWERMDDGSEKIAQDHLLDNVLNNQPNPETCAADFWQTVMVHILTTGNSYAEAVDNNAGQPCALYLRSPFRTMPYRRPNGQLAYKTNDTPGQYERWIDAENMCQFRGMGMDSLMGLSPVKYYAREVLGADLAAQSFGSRFFANDSRPGGVLTATGFMKADQKAAAIKSWMDAHGRGNSHRMAILDGGLTWQKIGVNPNEAQFLETRQFNRTQIAAIFGVPVHFLGEPVESRANAEQRGIEFLTYTIKPFIAKIEQTVNARMFPRIGRNTGRFFARMDTTMFERASYSDLLKGIQMGRYAGLYTVNEGRKLMGEQPYSKAQLDSNDPGDKLWQPVNMVVVTEDSLSGELPAQDVDGNGGAGQGGNDQSGGDGGGNGKARSVNRSVDDAEIKRYFLLFYGLFRDALGRALTRDERTPKAFQLAFTPILTQIAASFSFRGDSEPGDMVQPEGTALFIRKYIDFLAERGKDWHKDKADTIAVDELKRALRLLREQVTTASPLEESVTE